MNVKHVKINSSLWDFWFHVNRMKMKIGSDSNKTKSARRQILLQKKNNKKLRKKNSASIIEEIWIMTNLSSFRRMPSLPKRNKADFKLFNSVLVLMHSCLRSSLQPKTINPHQCKIFLLIWEGKEKSNIKKL